MMFNHTIGKKDLVLIGGGHAHVQVLRMLAMKPVSGVRVTLISEFSVAFYSGMLPGCLAELYFPDEIQMELRPLARWAGARFIRARATGVDPGMQQVLFEDRPPLGYDVLSINIGSVARGMDVSGVRDHAVATRPINRLIERVERVERALPPDSVLHPRVVVVGGGAAGVELAFGMHVRWQRRYGGVSVTLVDGNSRLLEEHGAGVRRIALRYFTQKGIAWISGATVQHVEPRRVTLNNGEALSFDLLLWATGGAAPPFLANTGLETDENGFLMVRPTLQTTRYDNVFAAGDCIHFAERPLPKAGVYAVREGPALTANLRAYLRKRPLKPYNPQPAVLALLMTGDGRSIASWRGIGLHGRWVWRVKDWIDRRWMEKFAPENFDRMMETEPESLDEQAGSSEERVMRCAGCGAKVGATILTGALASLKVHPNSRVQMGLDQADDAAVVQIPEGKWLAQTVDYFRAFIDDPYLLGRIAVLHAASDLFAMGAQPDTALVVATLPYAEKPLVAGDLSLLMEGIVREANAMGVTVTGGHTSEGTEMSVGIVMNGLIDRASMFTKRGLQPGDALILTKPLGTGALLAADMRLWARGVWIDRALDAMLVSNGPAACVFRQAGVTAVTDVTGFGLAGHLAEMLEAGGVGAEVWLEKLPVLPGAQIAIAQRIVSTLAPLNREHLTKRWRVDTHPADEIVYDPQTAGGLLAGVRTKQADAVLRDLRATGYPDAAVIGVVMDEPRRLRLV